jgi:hypothetical protein
MVRGRTRIRGYIQEFPDWVDNEIIIIIIIIVIIIIIIITTRWEATQRFMVAKLTRLTHKIAMQLHVLTESCIIYSARSRLPVRKLLGTPSYGRFGSHSELTWRRVEVVIALLLRVVCSLFVMNSWWCFPLAKVTELSDGVWYDGIGCMICKFRFFAVVVCFGVNSEQHWNPSRVS